MLLNRNRLGIANRHEPGLEDLIALKHCHHRVLLSFSGICRQVSDFSARRAVGSFASSPSLFRSSRNRRGKTRNPCNTGPLRAIPV